VKQCEALVNKLDWPCKNVFRIVCGQISFICFGLIEWERFTGLLVFLCFKSQSTLSPETRWNISRVGQEHVSKEYCTNFLILNSSK
jgi:hypothetical protein